MYKKKLFALALLAALPLAAQADDESTGPFTITATGTLTSDYVWRGVSQSQEDFALQGDLSVSHESGFYAGIFGSSVDFTAEGTSLADEDDADIEVDLYAGYGWDLSDEFAADIQLIRYIYPGTNEGFDYDYAELIGSVTYNEMITGTVAYTNNVFNLDDDGFYVSLAGSYGLPWWDLSLDGEVGHATIGSAVEVVDSHGDVIGNDDLKYMHYSLGLSREFGPASVSLTWADSDNDATDFYGEIADPRLFLSISLATDL